MPQLIITAHAARDLERCRHFLAEKNPLASRRAGQVIKEHLALLSSDPDSGRLLESTPPMRELIIPFGDSGYVALYRHESGANRVYLLALRHQKEAGYV